LVPNVPSKSRRLLYIADNGLPTFVHMHMLDADKLLTAGAKPSKELNLHCKSPHQAGRRRSEGRNSAFIRKRDVQLGKNSHCSRMRAGHLDGGTASDHPEPIDVTAGVGRLQIC
jgi:hypothetical protein